MSSRFRTSVIRWAAFALVAGVGMPAAAQPAQAPVAPGGAVQVPPAPRGAVQVPPAPRGAVQVPPAPRGVVQVPPAPGGQGFVATTTLFPGGGSPPAEAPLAGQYQGDAAHIAQGQRLFEWYNCSGCHFHGGGGMGPPLMDQQWIYGGRLDQIHASIVQGRPNGMPSWGHKIPDSEIWDIAAFVQSLSAPSAAEGAGQAMPQSPPPPTQSPGR